MCIVQASDLRQVTLYWVTVTGGNSTNYIVLAEDLERMVIATKKLHNEPGINPHNGVKTVKIGAIVSQPLKATGPYWWSTPDLQNNYDPRGARIWTWNSKKEEILWQLDGFDLEAAKRAIAIKA